VGLEALSFNLLVLKALCHFKRGGFHFYPFLCPPIKHFNPLNVKSARCATAGNTGQGKNGAGLKQQQRATKCSFPKEEMPGAFSVNIECSVWNTEDNFLRQKVSDWNSAFLCPCFQGSVHSCLSYQVTLVLKQT